MKADAEGFWYPVSSDACINCGLCEKVCPVSKPEKTANDEAQVAYACLTKDDEVWRKSASGGAFSEICYAWGDEKTIVVGAAWDGLKVHHICVEGVNSIATLRKSKYVASNPENTCREVRDYLKEGRKVIFCGTPCQVAGLKSYLHKTYENLLTIDLICHGVGSPAVFEKSVEMIAEKKRIHGVHYEFREKRRHYEEDYITSISDCNTTKYMTGDLYMNLFLSQLCLRPSCGKNCKFRDAHRQGDITLADFKGLREIFPELVGLKRNFSSLIPNTSLGESIVSALGDRMLVKPCSIDHIKKYNPLYFRQTWFSEDRDKFFNDFEKDPEGAIVKWQPKENWKVRFLNRLPISLKQSVLTWRTKHRK